MADAIERFRSDACTLVSRADVEPSAVVLALFAAGTDIACEQLRQDPRTFRVYGEACKAAMDRMVDVLIPAGQMPVKH